MSVRRTGLSGLALAMALGLAGCNGSNAQGGPPPAPEVGVVEIAAEAHEVTIQLSGRVSAFEVSEVRPQIGGIVRARLYQEGATVRAGQPLYEIDPGPAAADLAGAQASAASASARLERYERLLAINAVSQQEYDDARAAAASANSALQNARIAVGYTRVTAPISGVIGASSVTPGALATPNQAEPFAVIQRLDRVYVDMSQSSGDLLRLRNALAQSGVRTDRVAVRLTLEDGSTYPVEGVLQFSDVTINQSTGTVRLRAVFENPNRALLPGMFVTAAVSQGVDPDAILAPQRAVSRNPRGQAVALVLNQENVVEERVLETTATSGDRWVVASGLNPGDRVIVEGAQRVRPGAQAVAAEPTQPPQQQGALETLRGRQG
ncbi:MAG TPA: efflux RND transporter periplasmic adaptor subunit [Terricaulis sp.]|nr:efflux RND transporter periplasmic adaptor subunit [Terricaulis sp.]